jgi:G2/mitotic-specific cyclin 3/4
LKPLVTMIMECCENPQKHHSAVFEKYADRRYKRASVFVRGEMEKDFMLPSTQPQMSRQSLPAFEEFTDQMPFETHESFKRMVQVKG